MGGCCSKTKDSSKEEVTWREEYGEWVCRWEVVVAMVVTVMVVRVVVMLVVQGPHDGSPVLVPGRLHQGRHPRPDGEAG